MRLTILQAAVFALTLLVTSNALTANESDELREKANALKKDAAALLENGHKEEAAKLIHASKELLEQAERQEAKRFDKGAKLKGVDPHHNSDVQRLKERLHDLLSALEKVKESDSPEAEGSEIREQIAQTERKLEHLISGHRERDSIRPEFAALAEKLDLAARRMHHVRVAAENLKAAEIHDLADELMRRAENMEQEIHAAKSELAAKMRDDKKDRQPEKNGEIDEIRAENKRLRQELSELREVVERLRSDSESK